MKESELHKIKVQLFLLIDFSFLRRNNEREFLSVTCRRDKVIILFDHYRLSINVDLRIVLTVAADTGWEVTGGIGHVGVK